MEIVAGAKYSVNNNSASRIFTVIADQREHVPLNMTIENILNRARFGFVHKTCLWEQKE